MRSNKEKQAIKIGFLSGLIGGTLAKCLTHPMDLVKTKVQVTNLMGITKIISSTFNHEGIRGFYKGFPTAIAGSIPGCFIFFGTYDFSKTYLKKNEHLSNYPSICHFMSALIAEAVSCVIFVPVDVIKERRMSQSVISSLGEYNTDLNAFRLLLKQNGLLGLYKGYIATVLSFGPFLGITFAVFERMKKHYLNKSNLVSEISTITLRQSMICSITANIAASIITNPIDLIKVRLQVHKGNTKDKESLIYSKFNKGLRNILKEKGFIGVFRGGLIRALYNSLMGAVVLTMVDRIKPMLWRYYSKKNI